MERFAEQSTKLAYSDPPNDYYKEGEAWKWQDLPAVASAELGQRAVEIITDHLAQEIQSALQALT